MTKIDEMQSNSKPTVYYDGSCPLCSFEIGHYKKLAGTERVRFVDASKDDVPLGDDLSPAEAMGRFHVRRSDGTLVSGAEGFIEIWRRLPRWRWAARMSDLPGMIPLMELGYRAFLPLRPILSRIASWFGATPENSRHEC